MKNIDDIRKAVLKELWNDYYTKVPFASIVEKDLKKRNELWIEDHIAFRTLPGEHSGSHVLSRLFELIGYKKEDVYRFEDKSLDAFWLSPSDAGADSKDASAKIFVSELDLSGFDQEFKDIIERYTGQVKSSPLVKLEKLFADFNGGKYELANEIVSIYIDYFTKETPWSAPKLSDYHKLKTISEYASWTLLFGPKINHFTVCVHLLREFKDITVLGKHIEDNLGIKMNKAGGLVKGRPEIFLEQISTMAVELDYTFADANETVKYGFVEFAKRYTLENQNDDGMYDSYFQGFVVANANKIFESTFDK
jgi:hypothetical protein